MLISLRDEAARDPAVAGGKGSELAALIGRGLPVPNGFVVGTDVFGAIADTLGLEAAIDAAFERGKRDDDALTTSLSELRARLREHPLPAELRAALAATITNADTRWAVRSSAVAEDLEGASFAGQYDTVLGVRGVDAVDQAIRRCFASFLNPHALGYKRDRGIHELRAAVVLQELVHADVAGVCFSAHPRTGAADVVVLEASWGLGEAVVSGNVTPDTWVLDKASGAPREVTVGDKALTYALTDDGAVTTNTPADKRRQRCLSDEDAARIAALTTRIEVNEGRAVDIEWAIAGGELLLLQSRPITTLGETHHDAPPVDWHPELDTPIDPRWPMYSNGNISEVLPGVITPLTWSFVGPIIEASFRAQILGFGAMPDPGPEHRVLGFFYHRPYICISYLAEAATKTPGLSPDTIYEEFVGRPDTRTPPLSLADLSPRGVRTLGRVITTVATRLRSLREDAERQRDVVEAELGDSTPEQLAALTDHALVAPLAFSPHLVAPSVTHVWVSTAGVTAFSLLRKLTNAWLGDDDGALAASLITGLGGLPSADPAFGLHALAQRVREDEDLARAFADLGDPSLLVAIREHHAGFSQALDDFLAQHGHRAVCEAEFRSPSWREDPTQVLAMVRGYLGDNTTAPADLRVRQERARVHAETHALGSLSFWQRPLFRRVLTITRRSVALREQMKDVVVLRSDWARRRYDELGRRLVRRGWLSDPDDLFFLLGPESHALLEGQLDPEEARRIVARRRLDYTRCQQVDVPKIQEGAPRTSLPDDEDAADRLEGMGVCPGRVDGVARVILDPRHDCRVEPGEILVAPVTDAGWTPLFVNAAGLVVEVGGLLSHGSVVAREYGLPAVVGVAGATRHIRTGDRVRVDGARGVVMVLERDPSA